MNDPLIAALTRRVYQLEQLLAGEGHDVDPWVPEEPRETEPRSESRGGEEPPLDPWSPRDEEPPPPASPPPPAPPPPPPSPPADPREGIIEEANIVGTWLARIGALAILVGAGFGFKYGVDRGIIGPTLRVVLGLAASALLVGGSELSRRKGWNAFAQAIAGGGVALAYLSTLVAFQLYGLISGPQAFTGLIAITIAGGLLAALHRSPALTILSLFGAYLNPFLAWHAGHMQPAEALLYIIAVDVVVLFVARYRWAIVEYAAFIGTVIVFTAVQSELSTTLAFVFPSILLVVFIAPPFLRRAHTTIEEVLVPVATTGLYFGYVEHLLAGAHPSWSGWFSLILAVVLGGLAFVSMRLKDDETLAGGLFAPSVLFFLAFPPLEFHSPAILTAWAMQGVGVYAAGRFLKVKNANTGGLVLIHLAFAGSLIHLGYYTPDRILISTESVPVIATLASFIVATVVAMRTKDRIGSILAGEATFLTFVWLSMEAVAAVHRMVAPAAQVQVVGFTLSALWTLFSTITLAIGVSFAVRWARFGAAALLGIVVVKLALYDAWLLRAGYRVGVFIGVGCVLLACSVMYQRLRQLILEGAGPESHTRAA